MTGYVKRREPEEEAKALGLYRNTRGFPSDDSTPHELPQSH